MNHPHRRLRRPLQPPNRVNRPLRRIFMWNALLHLLQVVGDKRQHLALHQPEQLRAATSLHSLRQKRQLAHLREILSNVALDAHLARLFQLRPLLHQAKEI